MNSITLDVSAHDEQADTAVTSATRPMGRFAEEVPAMTELSDAVLRHVAGGFWRDGLKDIKL